MGALIPILTTALSVLGARGPNAKAWGSTPIPAILGIILGPQVLTAFQTGVSEAGLEPAAYALGAALGGLLAGGVQWVITWLTQKNEPKKA